MKNITFDYLYKNHKIIHSFGLGFIQIKLDEKNRVHIYHPQLIKTSTEEEIHNHRYGFKSHVMTGTLVNHLYSVNEDHNGGFVLFNESCNPKIESPKEKKVVNCSFQGSFQSKSGTQYELSHKTFHKVEALNKDLVITWLERGEILSPYAQVVVKKGEENKCPFSVNLPTETLWSMVKESL